MLFRITTVFDLGGCAESQGTLGKNYIKAI
jgi:hypothetical protein